MTKLAISTRYQLILLALCSLLLVTSCPQPLLGEAEPSATAFMGSEHEFDDMTVFYMGHSLLSDVPDMTEAIINNIRPNSFYFRSQNLPGAQLSWHWNNTIPWPADAAPGAQPPNGTGWVADDEPSRQLHFSIALASGNYSQVIVTDGVPRGRNTGYYLGDDAAIDDTVLYLGNILQAARDGRNDVQVYYYETWHHITSGLPGHDPYGEDNFDNRVLQWRARLDADAPMWDDIVRRVNEAYPAGAGQHPVKLIPAGRILGSVYDAMIAGQIPGFTALPDIFLDTIHTNNYGKYLVATIHAAVLSGRNPVDFIMDVNNVHGGAYFNVEVTAGYDDSGNAIRRTYPEFSPAVHRTFMTIIRDGVLRYYQP